MLKKVLTIGLFLGVALTAWAHSPLLYVGDNYDGTVEVEGGFSNGATPAGLPVIVVLDAPYDGPDETFEGKKVLFKTVFDEIGMVDVIKPDVEAYAIWFDGGKEHRISIKGPALEDDEREDWLEYIEANSSDLGVWKDYIMGLK